MKLLTIARRGSGSVELARVCITCGPGGQFFWNKAPAPCPASQKTAKAFGLSHILAFPYTFSDSLQIYHGFFFL